MATLEDIAKIEKYRVQRFFRGKINAITTSRSSTSTSCPYSYADSTRRSRTS